MDNKVIQTIKDRRSIRAYKKDQLVPQETIEILKECALYSPTAQNKQEWHFSFIENPTLILEMEEYIVSEILKNANDAIKERMASINNKVVYDAPLLVVISVDRETLGYYGKLDAGIAAQNLCLAAESLGLNSVMLGMVAPLFKGDKSDHWKTIVKMPETHDFAIAVAIGYGAMEGIKKELDYSKISVVK